MAQTNSLDLEASSSQYAYIADTVPLRCSGDFTLEAWIKVETLSSGLGYSQTILSKDGTNVGWTLRIESSANKIDFVRNDATQYTGATSITAGAWYHVAVTMSSATLKIYLNGREDFSGAYTDHTDATNQFRVGESTGNTGRYFDGLIKDVRVFSDARSASEVLSDAHTEDVSDANLVAEWNFNNAYTDSSGNGNTLTGSGSPTFPATIPWTAPAGGDSLQAIASMVSWWTLDEASGSRADAHSSNDLSDNNTVASDTGKWSLAADFEASNSEYLSIANGSQTGMNLTGSYSIAFWMKGETLPNNATIISRWTNAGGNQGYLVQISSSHIVLQTNANDTVGAITLSTGTWYHVVCVYDSSSTRHLIYVNGVLDTTEGSITAPTSNSSSFVIGTLSTLLTGFYYDGLVDEASLYNIALDYGAVLDLYAAGAGIPYIGSTNYDETYSESQTATDSVDIVVQRTLSESKTATDDLLAAPARTLSESQTPTDTFASAFIILETLSEAVSAVDSIVRSGIRVLAEALTATDTFIRDSVRTLTESKTATDTFATVLALGRILTESVSATDIIRKVLNGNSTIWNGLTKFIGSWTNRDKV